MELYSHLQQQIDLAFRNDTGYKSWGAKTIVVPDGDHTVSQPLVVPDGANIVMRSMSKWSARLTNTSSDANIINVEGSQGVGHLFALSNLVINEGCIEFTGKRRGCTQFHDVKLTRSPEQAVKFLGDSTGLGPTRWELNDVDFVDCAGAVAAKAQSYMIGSIVGGSASATHGLVLDFDCIGTRVVGFDMAGASGKAFIKYGGDVESTSHHIVEQCRFSSEDVNSDQGIVPTPSCDVLVGEEAASSAKKTSVLRFRDNLHAGSRPGDPGADHAFLFTNQPRSVSITGSRFTKNYKGALIQNESGIDALDSVFRDNHVQSNGPVVFNDDTGWTL